MESQKLKKIDVVNKINEKGIPDIDKQQIQIIIDSFLSEIKESLIQGKSIELRGFGTFEPKLKKEKKGARNVVTGEFVTVQPHFVATFKPGRELKQNMWKLDIENNEDKK